MGRGLASAREARASRVRSCASGTRAILYSTRLASRALANGLADGLADAAPSVTDFAPSVPIRDILRVIVLKNVLKYLTTESVLR